MSSTRIPEALRQDVLLRARDQCEYCLRPAIVHQFSYHVDHIISEQHRGSTDFNNLAWCCPECNAYKGTNLSTYLPEEGLIVNLFNPRKESWSEHFSLNEDGSIQGKSKTAIGTIYLLRLNQLSRRKERAALLNAKYSFFADE